MIKTKNDVLVATDFVRIVHGGRGDYVEFTKDQMILENISIIRDTIWRLSEKWKNRVYYVEYRTTDNIKIYYQKRLVKYADYKLKHFYIALQDLKLKNKFICGIGI